MVWTDGAPELAVEIRLHLSTPDDALEMMCVAQSTGDE